MWIILRLMLARMLPGIRGPEGAWRLCRSSVRRRGSVGGRRCARIRWVGATRKQVSTSVNVLPLSLRDKPLLLETTPVLKLHLGFDPHSLIHLILDAGQAGPAICSSAEFSSRQFHGFLEMFIDSCFRFSLPPISCIFLPSLLLHRSLSFHPVSLHPLSLPFISLVLLLPISGRTFFL